MFDLQLPLTCNPWTTLSNPCNKVRGKILLKKFSCIFVLLASLSLCRCELFYIYMCMYVDVNLHMWLYNSNLKCSLAASDPFDYVLKVTNHTHQICLNSLEHSRRTHDFQLIWLCLIIKVLVTQVKFHKSVGYCTVINCAFTFYTTNVFGCFYVIRAQFKLISISSWIRLYCMFIFMTFKLHTE